MVNIISTVYIIIFSIDYLFHSPFDRNHHVLRETAQHVTRFISLAHVGNTAKKKVMIHCSL